MGKRTHKNPLTKFKGTERTFLERSSPFSKTWVWSKPQHVYKLYNLLVGVVSTHLKNMSQNGNLPQIGVNINIFETHHPVFHSISNTSGILRAYTPRKTTSNMEPVNWWFVDVSPSWRRSTFRFQPLVFRVREGSIHAHPNSWQFHPQVVWGGICYQHQLFFIRTGWNKKHSLPTNCILSPKQKHLELKNVTSF